MDHYKCKKLHLAFLGVPRNFQLKASPFKFLIQVVMSHRYILLEPHAVPQWLDPLPAQDPEDHHEGVEEVREVPPGQGVRLIGRQYWMACVSKKKSLFKAIFLSSRIF